MSKSLYSAPVIYNYFPYMGEAFFEQFRSSRFLPRQRFAHVKENVLVDELILALRELSSNTPKAEVRPNVIDFSKYLVNFLVSENNELDIYTFVKKFEVSRRLSAWYDKQNLKPIGSSEDMVVYIGFSVILLKMFRESNDLRLLNCSLKINDFLVHNISLFDDFVTGLVGALLNVEQREIHRLVAGYACE